jgi:hypothetical protein
VFRKTLPYVEITKPLDREFPPNRCWNCNNYLVAIWDNKEYTQYNFVFNNFGTSQVKADGKAYERKIEKPLTVKRIVLWYNESNALLRGI